MHTATSTLPITRKFPTAHLYLSKYYERTPEQRSRSRAEYGIRQAEHRIGYETERMEIYIADGPLEGEGMEEDRLDNIQLCKNSIASHHRRIVKHRKTLASLPAQA